MHETIAQSTFPDTWAKLRRLPVVSKPSISQNMPATPTLSAAQSLPVTRAVTAKEHAKMVLEQLRGGQPPPDAAFYEKAFSGTNANLVRGFEISYGQLYHAQAVSLGLIKADNMFKTQMSFMASWHIKMIDDELVRQVPTLARAEKSWGAQARTYLIKQQQALLIAGHTQLGTKRPVDHSLAPPPQPAPQIKRRRREKSKRLLFANIRIHITNHTKGSNERSLVVFPLREVTRDSVILSDTGDLDISQLSMNKLLKIAEEHFNSNVGLDKQIDFEELNMLGNLEMSYMNGPSHTDQAFFRCNEQFQQAVKESWDLANSGRTILFHCKLS